MPRAARRLPVTAARTGWPFVRLAAQGESASGQGHSQASRTCTTASLRSSTRQSCAQTSRFFSKGVSTRPSTSSMCARSLRQARKAARCCASSCPALISGVHAGRRGMVSLRASRAWVAAADFGHLTAPGTAQSCPACTPARLLAAAASEAQPACLPPAGSVWQGSSGQQAALLDSKLRFGSLVAASKLQRGPPPVAVALLGSPARLSCAVLVLLANRRASADDLGVPLVRAEVPPRELCLHTRSASGWLAGCRKVRRAGG